MQGLRPSPTLAGAEPGSLSREAARVRGERPDERTLHVDHDHQTGVVRGLRCFRCNNALGDFREYELFRRAAGYLDRDDELAAMVRERVGTLAG